MANLLFIDVETYSSVDIKSCGAYKYQDSLDFEVLIVGYAFDNEEVTIIDLASGEKLPERFVNALTDKSIKKVAHNSVFERLAFGHLGFKTTPDDWLDTMIMSAYCGLPLSLDEVSKVLNLTDKKLSSGKLLIKYFSCPCPPTKINGGRYRNLPKHAPEKWEMYKEYNKYDVLSERGIRHRRLSKAEVDGGVTNSPYVSFYTIPSDLNGVTLEIQESTSVNVEQPPAVGTFIDGRSVAGYDYYPERTTVILDVFKPLTTNLMGTVTLGDATHLSPVLALSALDGPFVLPASEFALGAAEGATVRVNVGERKVTSKTPIISWTSSPAGVSFAWPDGTPASMGSLVAKDDGLYAVTGFMILFR